MIHDCKVSLRVRSKNARKAHTDDKQMLKNCFQYHDIETIAAPQHCD